MNSIWEFFKTISNPESIMAYGGLALLLLVVFAETGLLVGFFLPGDNLIFLSGLFCAIKPKLVGNTPILLLLLLLIAAAVLGNCFGYFFGKKAGPKLFTKDDNLIFKKKYLLTTQSFYERHGGKALVLGRFLPVVRTFVPILAGAIHMNFKRFMALNLLGAALWILSIGSLGYFLGKKFPQIENYLGYIIISMIVITTIPVIFTYQKEKLKSK